MEQIKQSANAVLMIKPVDFCFNEEAAKDNSFMTNVQTSNSPALLAIEEFEKSVEILQKNGIKVHVFDKSKY